MSDITLTDSELEREKADAQRYRFLKAIAQQDTSYDRYHNGAFWTIGLHSKDRRESLDDAVDAAKGLYNYE